VTQEIRRTWVSHVRRRPHLLALLLPVAAWVAILTKRGHVHTTTLTAWTLMCVAMMVPVVLPALRHVAVNSLRRRQGRAMAVFLAGYLAVWVVAGAVLLPLFALPPQPVLLTGVLLFAALWQLLPARRACMRACHRTVPLPPTGWRAARGDLRFGLRHGVGCLGVCGPLMAVMAVPGTHHPLWMFGVTGAVLLTRYPPRWRPRTALVLDASYRLKG
jgi:predicted metal-binding membrane protein